METKFLAEAMGILKIVREDALYIARLLRRYNVKKKDYSASTSLHELIAPAVPSEEEVMGYFRSSNSLTEKLKDHRINGGARKYINRTLDELYFNPNYKLP